MYTLNISLECHNHHSPPELISRNGSNYVLWKTNAACPSEVSYIQSLISHAFKLVLCENHHLPLLYLEAFYE